MTIVIHLLVNAFKTELRGVIKGENTKIDNINDTWYFQTQPSLKNQVFHIFRILFFFLLIFVPTSVSHKKSPAYFSSLVVGTRKGSSDSSDFLLSIVNDHILNLPMLFSFK